MFSAECSNILATNAELVSDGLRVLPIAFRPRSDPDPHRADGELIFVGMIGMIDSPRSEV